MPLNLRDLTRMCEFSFELQSLGVVHCPCLNSNHISQANMKLDSSTTHSSDFVRWLFGELARRHVKKGISEEDSIDKCNFTAAELNSVTNEELETFADKLIQKNKYLLKTIKSKYIERSIDESANDFLVRAFIHHKAEQRAQWKRVTKPLSSTFLANASLKAMQRNLGLSNQLQGIAHTCSRAEQILIGEKKKWEDMTQSVSQLFSANAAFDVIQRNYGALDQLRDAHNHLDSGQFSASRMLSMDIYRSENMLMKSALELTQIGKLSAGVEGQLQANRGLLKSYEAMFRLPQAFEVASLLTSSHVGAVAELAQQHAKGALDRQNFIESITIPWINSTEVSRSVTAALELQGLVMY